MEISLVNHKIKHVEGCSKYVNYLRHTKNFYANFLDFSEMYDTHSPKSRSHALQSLFSGSLTLLACNKFAKKFTFLVLTQTWIIKKNKIKNENWTHTLGKITWISGKFLDFFFIFSKFDYHFFLIHLFDLILLPSLWIIFFPFFYLHWSTE